MKMKAHIQEQIPARAHQPHRLTLRDVERSAAEKLFFEQNAWANPSVAHAMAQSQPFATPTNHATGIAGDLLMMSTPVSAVAVAPSRNGTPNSRGRSVTKLPGTTTARDTERIQTTHNSSSAGAASTTGQEVAESSLAGQTFAPHVGESKEFFGLMENSVMTAPVGGGGGGIRYPP